jgi:hypothetical protein
MNENITLNVNRVTTFLSLLTFSADLLVDSFVALFTVSLNTKYLSAKAKHKKISTIRIKTIHSINRYSRTRYDY